MAGIGQQHQQQQQQQQHPPFSNDEKNFLLAEVIKSASPPYGVLLEVCNRYNIQPSLEDLPLPSGRSLNACRHAFDEMRRPMYSPLSQGGSAAGPLSGPIPPLKRPPGVGLSFGPGSSAGRVILPKTSSYNYPNIAEPPLKRKRGRPTKAEQQARAEQQAESSSMGGRFQTPHSASMRGSPIIDTRPASTILPPVTRMPISAIVTPVAAAPSTSHSSSSSGKHRRRRRSEETSLHGESRGSHAYTSPYARPMTMLASEDTPARTAAMRRRDDPIHSSNVRLGASESEQSAGAQSISPRPPYTGIP